jgi:uncharacterized membrane protein AbrB (regulator of aidB expression)
LAYKPGSVIILPMVKLMQPFVWGAVYTVKFASSNLPGWLAWKLPMLSTTPSLFGFAPGGVYNATLVNDHAVGSYPTFSPLPMNQEDP